MNKGKITRISGPIVYASGLEGCCLYEVVDVGNKKLIGEIISQEKGMATIEVYEDDSGMGIGEEVVSSGRPLSLKLGPGLVGTIYDGIQRPLKKMFESGNAFLTPGQRTEPLDTQKKWDFVPEENIQEGTEIHPGMVLGYVQETGSIKHKIMVPPDVKGKKLSSFAGSGSYTIDEQIAETDAGEKIFMAQYWPLRKPRPFAKKLEVTEPLVTGQRVIDVFFPLSKGGTAAIPGGFGTGKTMSQHQIAKWSDADIIIYIGCGERGNEMTQVLEEFSELIDPRSGNPLMDRTTLIANTSNMPVAAREASIYTGITLAEYYRDMGYHVAIMADSTSRWAEALRELSGRLEEMPAEEGFPAYLASRLSAFYERAGYMENLNGTEGSVSIIGAVSPQGGDFSEPVTQNTKRFVRCFWGL
ncbi:MAG: V-type ATP synthase subunit A, partial [Treponema sp.]|nr:V-type ATP synthase subunit A [Treponema sp.]